MEERSRHAPPPTALQVRMTHRHEIPAAFLILTNGNPEEWSAVVDEQHKTIGRSRQCEIPLSQKYNYVSRRHAEIYRDGRAIKLRDLGSRSGTRVNGVWVDRNKEVTIVPGDRIWMGGVELEVVAEIPAAKGVEEYFGDSIERDDDISGQLGPTRNLHTQLLLAELTPAELAVVMWIQRGYLKDEDIAAKLFRSPNTVRTQVNSIFRKLHVHSRADIISLLKASDWTADNSLDSKGAGAT
jgi:DNA-binding CsgD family transcriptional regulator